MGGCDGAAGWGCYFEPVSRCSLAALGLSGQAAATPEKVWSESGWKPWQRDNAAEQPWLWSACGNQMNKYAAKKPGQQAPAPFDHHSNDFWPMAPKPPLSIAHRGVSATAWQAAFVRDLTLRPTALTRGYIDNVAAGLGWQSPWSSGFALEGHEYRTTIGLQIRRGDKYQAGKHKGQDELSDVEAFEQVFLPAVQRLASRSYGEGEL